MRAESFENWLRERTIKLVAMAVFPIVIREANKVIDEASCDFTPLRSVFSERAFREERVR